MICHCNVSVLICATTGSNVGGGVQMRGRDVGIDSASDQYGGVERWDRVLER